MSLKKSLIALTIVHTGIAFTQDKPGMSNAVKTLVVAPVAAVGLMGVEAAYRWYRAGINYGSDAIYPAGPLRTVQAERLARNNFRINIGSGGVQEIGWWRYHSEKEVKNAIENQEKYFSKEALTNSIPDKINDLRIAHEEKSDFMRKYLPKIFKKYALYRNTAFIWGGMHIYDACKAMKKEKYS